MENIEINSILWRFQLQRLTQQWFWILHKFSVTKRKRLVKMCQFPFYGLFVSAASSPFSCEILDKNDDLIPFLESEQSFLCKYFFSNINFMIIMLFSAFTNLHLHKFCHYIIRSSCIFVSYRKFLSILCKAIYFLFFQFL